MSSPVNRNHHSRDCNLRSNLYKSVLLNIFITVTQILFRKTRDILYCSVVLHYKAVKHDDL